MEEVIAKFEVLQMARRSPTNEEALNVVRLEVYKNESREVLILCQKSMKVELFVNILGSR